MKIIRNRIRCLSCGQVIESKTVQHFVYCSCGKVAVDGGSLYVRRVFPSGQPAEWYEEMTEYEILEGMDIEKQTALFWGIVRFDEYKQMIQRIIDENKLLHRAETIWIIRTTDKKILTEILEETLLEYMYKWEEEGKE